MTVSTVPLGKVAEFVRGITFKPADVVEPGEPGSVVCLRTKNVQREVDLDDLLAVSSAFVKRDNQYLQAGDVLISSANSWNLVGKCSWIPELPWKASFGGFVTALRPKTDEVDRRYLYRWFSYGRTQQLLRSFGRKTTNISNLNLDRCRSMDFPLPPIEEQRRIAAVLDAAEALRAKRREALAKLDTLTEAIFIDMFGDPILSDAHPRKTIGSIAEVVTGNTPSRAEAQNYGSDLEWLKSDNIEESGVITEAAECLSAIGRAKGRVAPVGASLLVCIAGSPKSIGRVGLLDRQAAFNQQINAVIPGDALRPEFLFHQLKAGQRLVRRASTNSMKGMVSKSALMAVELLVPTASEQDTFVQAIAGLAPARDSAVRSAQELDRLFASLQQRAFRGEL